MTGGLMEWQHYPDALQIISLGAGRQSSVMYLMAVGGEIEPCPAVAIFADTGNEPPHVYEQLDYLKQFSDVIPIEVVTAGNIYDDSMAALSGDYVWGDGRWVGPPMFSEGGGPIHRKCTSHYKIRPLERFSRQLMGQTGCSAIVNWRGHTTNEIQRAKPDKRRYMVIRWPLLEQRMTDYDCSQWLKRNGHPQFQWSACEICPFRARDIRYARQLQAIPESWRRIIEFDERARNLSAFGLERRCYLNAEYLPMAEFINRPDDDHQPSLFGCDSGMCGL